MMKVLCTRAAKCEAGATAVEYALTAALVSVALVSGADMVRTALDNQFMKLSQTLSAASDVHRRSSGGASLAAEPGSAPGAVQGAASSSRTPP